MKVVRLTLNKIEIHSAGEDDAEWRFKVSAKTTAGGTGYLYKEWNVDGVSSGDVYPLGDQAVFLLNDSEEIFLETGGFEVDNPGFPLFDPNDDIPAVRMNIKPDTAGLAHRVSVSNGEFDYTLEMGFAVKPISDF
jgi:hypothetical protein